MKSVLAFTLIFGICVAIGYYMLRDSDPLPIYNPADLNPRLVDDSLRKVKAHHRVKPFLLVNQLGDTVTDKEFQNKIYVADFFFTRCQTICPVMTDNMEMVQEAFENEEEVMIISHSVTPVADSIPVLRTYSIEHGANDAKWMFVTGDKKHIYDLARNSYFAVLDEGDGGMQDFIHTENFVLVDKEKRLRGFYDGTSEKEVKKLIQDIKKLRREEPKE